MSTEEWTLLVKRVDMLIKALKQSRLEVNHWRTKAAELERLHRGDDTPSRLELQAKDRELERLKKDRKKIKTVVVKVLEELQLAEKRILEQANDKK